MANGVPATTEATAMPMAISKVIHFTTNEGTTTSNGIYNPPFIPVNNPGIAGDGIIYGSIPTAVATNSAGSGYVVGQTYETSNVGRPPISSTGEERTFNPMGGVNLTITPTALNTSGGITAADIVNPGTGYGNTTLVEVINPVAGGKPCRLSVTTTSTNVNQIVAENKEAQLEQCQRLYPLNPATGLPYAEVQNGSNVNGITVTKITPDDPLEVGSVSFTATVVDSTGAEVALTSAVWTCNGAGLSDNSGTAGSGLKNRSFTFTEAGVAQITILAANSAYDAPVEYYQAFTITDP